MLFEVRYHHALLNEIQCFSYSIKHKAEEETIVFGSKITRFLIHHMKYVI